MGMVIIVYADINADTIQQEMGRPDYSYYFVLEAFRPALETLATVVTVRDPSIEVDAIFNVCKHLGEPCLFLSFTPPHKTP